jgi:hypothetical protein
MCPREAQTFLISDICFSEILVLLWWFGARNRAFSSQCHFMVVPMNCCIDHGVCCRSRILASLGCSTLKALPKRAATPRLRTCHQSTSRTAAYPPPPMRWDVHPATPAAQRRDLVPGLVRLGAACLAHDPAARPGMTAIKRALEALAQC